MFGRAIDKKQKIKVHFREALEIICIAEEHSFQRRTNLESDGIELSIVPWKRIIRGRRKTALLTVGSFIIISGENCGKDCSPSIML